MERIPGGILHSPPLACSASTHRPTDLAAGALLLALAVMVDYLRRC